MPKVELVGIGKTFGKVVASSDISLTIGNGEYVTVLGPSGCGKTTLIRMIAGIYRPTSGRILMDGRDVTDVPVEDRNVAYVFQNIALFPHLTVQGNAAYGPMVRGRPEEEIESVPKRYLELVRMLDRMSMFPSELSGGEQQKVSLARALSSGSDLLLLDEPLSALDARVRMDLRYELRRLAKSLGLTVVHVTHDQEEAMTVSDRIVLMRAGRIVESGSPEDMYLRPKELFTANFIGETNLLEGTVRGPDADATLVELRDGTIVEARPSGFHSGDPVVLSVRPERVHSAREGLHAIVQSATFMGSFARVVAEADSGDIIEFDVPAVDAECYKLGDDVSLVWSRRSGITYRRPAGGIAEAVRLE